MNTNKLLSALFKEFLKEMNANQSFKNRIADIIEKHTMTTRKLPAPEHSRRRKPGPFDPITVYRKEPESLQSQLEPLTIEELKDIIAENGMDRSKLAMRWKTKGRLIDLIVNTVKDRAQKGDSFRNMHNKNSTTDNQ